MSGCRYAVGIVVVLVAMTASMPSVAQAESAVVDDRTAVDASLLTTLLGRLREHDTVKVKFTQQKKLRILKRPLQSEGSLVFRRSRGMVWQVTAPVAATYVLNDKGMRELGAQAGSSIAAHSSMPDLLPLFDAIFAGDEATLARNFDYRIAGSAQQWQLLLTPRDAMLLRVFDRLELTGGNYIDSITLFDTRGDQTRIELHEPRFGTDKLSADEKSLLP